jgi:hypothetical protein
VRDDGRVVYRLSRPWSDGTSAVLFAPQDFLARLCALIPPPRFHMLRYHGVFAARASMRGEIVGIANPDHAATSTSAFDQSSLRSLRPPESPRGARRPRPSPRTVRANQPAGLETSVEHRASRATRSWKRLRRGAHCSRSDRCSPKVDVGQVLHARVRAGARKRVRMQLLRDVKRDRVDGNLRRCDARETE